MTEAAQAEAEKIGAIMVVGGGVSGMQAALDLANSGFYVHLVERSGAIGGTMAQLDKTFPTNDCSMCIIAPKLVECGRHPNIKILTLAKILDVEGQEGNFTVRVKEYPRWVDPDKCIACGQCADQCPQAVEDRFNGDLAQRKAIYIKYPQAVPLKYQIDPDACLWLNNPGQCGLCARICPADAVNFADREQKQTIQVGAIIMAPGFQPFDPGTSQAWGFGRYPNVITSLQFERLLAPTGPTGGVVTRPSDGRPVRKIAFLQCVGSRDKNRCNNEYCSSVCCMAAIKEAMIAKEQLDQVEITIFHSDMRTHGKDFERFFIQAKVEYDINFVRTKIHGVEPQGNKGNLRLHYVNQQGKQVDQLVDLVILSVGLETPDSTLGLAERMGIHITPDRFASISAFMPVSSSKKGIFTCGAFNGPRDIPQSVIGGSAAAASASQLLAPARHTRTQASCTPHEVPQKANSPRTGVFICHCGSNIAGVVDVDELAAYAATLPDVIHVEQNPFTCAQDTQDYITQQIREKQLNRIVIAACTPQTHEPLFRRTLRAAGINEHLIEMANIRNQNAWVHKNEPARATIKAKDLIRMAVAKIAIQEPLYPLRIPVIPSALIIGGGVSGMTAALNLAGQGFKVDLVEKSTTLGGNALHLYQTWSGEHVPRYLKELQQQISQEPRVAIHFNTTVVASSGQAGHFKTTLRAGNGRKKSVDHGATIITTGGKRYIPSEFGYGQIPNVVASIEFDKLHMHNEIRVTQGKSFVFIQCVGSRNEKRPYCSKSCCTHSIQSAIKLKQEAPERRIYILYREIRTYGQRERIYNQARELGIIFINYELKGPPIIGEEGGRLLVSSRDHVLHRPLEIEADMVILATATLADPGSAELAKLFKLPLNQDGFFQEAHAKLRPVEFNTDGVFVAGLAHYPKPVEESISQALAAASKATTLLARESVELDAITAHVDPEFCDGCGICLEVCPYQAITLLATIDEQGEEHKIIEIDPALCKGCGICQGACPKRGVYITGFSYEQLLAQIDAALEPPKP
ncbi:CoB--CoM heterodisulfide reductase iron-sulfur subunit A family protein [Desulfogranum mediterraneum]|uniref:CoB--CoM heterodisulfide reductase iron-sulfur subunit A family protein n=1 Tax=Desulfogranum mediterraneum TaxID=160661 RepID=UPI0003F5F664|nr:CoB--CoM heterodisulfide reductase iron-sulfur subunit A family protein [Desulfogranum mediterraneum]